jgi:predicted acyl esterase
LSRERGEHPAPEPVGHLLGADRSTRTVLQRIINEIEAGTYRPNIDRVFGLNDIEAITVPMLVCGSFSDHNLQSRGSFELFRRAGSASSPAPTPRVRRAR